MHCAAEQDGAVHDGWAADGRSDLRPPGAAATGRRWGCGVRRAPDCCGHREALGTLGYRCVRVGCLPELMARLCGESGGIWSSTWPRGITGGPGGAGTRAAGGIRHPLHAVRSADDVRRLAQADGPMSASRAPLEAGSTGRPVVTPKKAYDAADRASRNETNHPDFAHAGTGRGSGRSPAHSAARACRRRPLPPTPARNPAPARSY